MWNRVFPDCRVRSGVKLQFAARRICHGATRNTQRATRNTQYRVRIVTRCMTRRECSSVGIDRRASRFGRPHVICEGRAIRSSITAVRRRACGTPALALVPMTARSPPTEDDTVRRPPPGQEKTILGKHPAQSSAGSRRARDAAGCVAAAVLARARGLLRTSALKEVP